MQSTPHDVVTGAFGYIGKYIARHLLNAGRRVTTLTSRPLANSPFGNQVPALPLSFDQPAHLVDALRGTDTLYNTYWVRFERGAKTFARAIANTAILLDAAEQAGVRRIVHISITNPAHTGVPPYFRGKAQVEQRIRTSRLTHAIIRPTVVFGDEDILINNIAWLLRRSPVFLIPGDGKYRVQPVFVDDLAAMAVAAGERTENETFDAVGPDTFTFAELIRTMSDTLGRSVRIVPVPPMLALFAARVFGALCGDVMLTRDELAALMSNLLISNTPATCPTRLTDWLKQSRNHVGISYSSELARHFRNPTRTASA